MAVGNAVLDVVLAPGFFEHVDHMGLLLKQSLASVADRHPAIIESVRGEGLLIGIKAKINNGELVSALRDQHLLSVGAGDNVVRLLPPLIIDESHVASAIERLEKACVALEQQAAHKAKTA